MKQAMAYIPTYRLQLRNITLLILSDEILRQPTSAELRRRYRRKRALRIENFVTGN
jgi:hypothetical protein